MGILKIFSGRLIFLRLTMLIAMILLVLIGIITIYASGNPLDTHSATDPPKPGPNSNLWKKQCVFAIVGLLGFILIGIVDYRRVGAMSYWIYAVVLALLAVLLLGKYISIPIVPVINGTCRWIRIGIGSHHIQIQPSEFCKLSYILALAWYLRFRSNYRKFPGLLGPFLLTLLAIILILFEPDLGTVLLMMPILFAMLFVAGARVKHLLIIIMMAVLISPLLWRQMRPYQRERISCVALQSQWLRQKAQDNPKISTLLTGKKHFDLRIWRRGMGWQLRHSKLAIASGGLKGYGFRKGPYIKYAYLPERHNDFIFAIIAHQWGFIGCAILLLLYGTIIGCGVEIAWLNTDPFARLVSVGLVAMLAMEVIVNVSMTLGLMPITGLTLPLVSYGGSSLVVSMISIGLLNNIGSHRPFTVAGKSFEHRA